MSEPFTIPEEFHESFRRLLPHLAPPLRSNEQVLHSILLYLKLGNEKLARIALDAFNETQRLNDLENQKRLREEALLRENQLGVDGEASDLDDVEDEEEKEKDEDSVDDVF